MQIKTASIQVDFVRNNISNMSSQWSTQYAQILLPPFCDLLQTGCADQVITQRSILLRMALTAQNGDTQTQIGMSKSLEMSLYRDDAANSEVYVSNLEKPVGLWIPRQAVLPFKLVDMLNVTFNQTWVIRFTNTNKTYI